MKYKIIYSEKPLYIEVEANSEQERKDALNGIIFTLQDYYKKMWYQKSQQIYQNNTQIVTETKVQEEVDKNIQQQQKQEELATDGKIRLMIKWKINFPDNCTKRQACNLIHQYKRDHGMDDR